MILRLWTSFALKVRQQIEKVEQLVKDGEDLMLGENLDIIVIIIITFPFKETKMVIFE